MAEPVEPVERAGWTDEERLELVESLRPFALIPLYRGGKVPAWERWTEVPPMGPELVELHLAGECPCKSCERRTGGGNFGIRTGQQMGVEQQVVVIDADIHKEPAAEAALEALDLPETWTVETGGGGLHLYFVAPRGIWVRNSVRALGAGIDVRGDGGQVVAPGSVHPSGRLYRWRAGLDPATVPLADLPDDVLERISEDRKPATSGIGGGESRAAVAPLPGPGAKKMPPIAQGLDPLLHWPGVPEGQRNNLLAKAIGAALRADVGTKAAWNSAMALNGRCDPPMDEKRLRRTFESILGRDKRRYPAKYEDERRLIFLGSNLQVATDQAEEALLETFAPGSPRALYQHGGCLVQVVEGDEGQPVIRPVMSASLKEALSSAARFRTDPPQRRGVGLPPGEIVSSLMHRGSWRFARLSGISDAPFIRADGSLVLKPGYDAASRTVSIHTRRFSAEGCQGSPSLEEAQAAISRLSEPLRDFPFKTRSDKATALALLLTVVGRQAIAGETPMFAIRAHTSRSGKGLLAKCLVLMGTGRPAAMSLPVSEKEELRKRLFAAALAGERTVILDNEEGVFGSKVLSALLTAGSIHERILGQSRLVQVPWRAVTVVTGNNITFAHDQAPRTLLIEIDPALERPETRVGWRFPRLLAHVREHAAESIMDALLVLRAHAVAGRPAKNVRPLGGFEDWNSVVRHAVIWAMGSDPLDTQSRIWRRGDDEDALALKHYLRVAWGLWQGRRKTSRQIVTMARHSPALAEALEDLIPDGHVTPARVGYTLRRARGRIVGGLKVDSATQGGGVARWRIEGEPDPPIDPFGL
ncbi:MAG: bifunctional DNA primase/polymerase, partial [Planctomycetota bacterium]